MNCKIDLWANALTVESRHGGDAVSWIADHLAGITVANDNEARIQSG
jgi:hypothetical protein